MLPIEILIEIYKKCNKETRIKMNKSFRWNYKILNPFFDYNFSSIVQKNEFDNSWYIELKFNSTKKICIYSEKTSYLETKLPSGKTLYVFFYF
jgi:transposase